MAATVHPTAFVDEPVVCMNAGLSQQALRNTVFVTGWAEED